MPIAMMLLPLIPGMVQTLMELIAVIRADPGTDAEMRDRLDAHQRLLEQISDEVEAYTPKDI